MCVSKALNLKECRRAIIAAERGNLAELNGVESAQMEW